MVRLRCRTCGTIGSFRSESLGMVWRLGTQHQSHMKQMNPEGKPEDHIIYVEAAN